MGAPGSPGPLCTEGSVSTDCKRPTGSAHSWLTSGFPLPPNSCLLRCCWAGLRRYPTDVQAPPPSMHSRADVLSRPATGLPLWGLVQGQAGVGEGTVEGEGPDKADVNQGSLLPSGWDISQDPHPRCGCSMLMRQATSSWRCCRCRRPIGSKGPAERRMCRKCLPSGPKYLPVNLTVLP